MFRAPRGTPGMVSAVWMFRPLGGESSEGRDVGGERYSSSLIASAGSLAVDGPARLEAEDRDFRTTLVARP